MADGLSGLPRLPLAAPTGSAFPGAPAGLAADARSLDGLRHAAARDPRAATKQAAQQFETIFLQEVLKSMRAASMKTGMLDNAGTELGSEMLDGQWAQRLAGRPGGLSELIERQLTRHLGGDGAASTATVTVPPAALPGRPAPGFAGPAAPANPTSIDRLPGRSAAPPLPARFAQLPRDLAAPRAPGPQGDFLRANWDAARAAEAETGIPAPFVLAQAAHESGWGRRQIRNADGSPSHNVFGIKAGPGWTGKVAEVTTTEYLGGQPRRMVQRFRAYDSPEDAFRDWARLIKGNRRYEAVVRDGATVEGFTRGLQQAGYATDPAYADKLARVIGTTLRLQRASA